MLVKHVYYTMENLIHHWWACDVATDPGPHFATPLDQH